MRSMWNGNITFGLVNIPVGMYPATKENQISFHLLHKKDCGRIKNQRVCSVCGEVLDYDELIKGFEYEKGEYVPVTDEDLKMAQPESTETIAIQGFVDLDAIDPIYFDHPYYLTPAHKSDRVYVLLREALKKSGKVGVASFVLRTKKYLAAVRPYGDALVLNTMHYADEVREADELPEHGTGFDDSEMAMAIQLIESMGEKFRAKDYKDDYNDALTELIEKKLAGKKITAKSAVSKPTNVLDLMSRLKASLEQTETQAKQSDATAKMATTKAKPTSKTKPTTKKPTKPRGTEKDSAAGKPKLKLVA